MSSQPKLNGKTNLMTPKRDIWIEGFRLDQMYTRAKASDEARKGIVTNGEMT
jgi:hypothetical protein